MRPLGPGATKPEDTNGLCDRTRRRLIAAGLLCAATPALALAQENRRYLFAGQSYSGGRIIQRPNEAGFTNPAMGGMGAMTLFAFPVSVAVTPMRDIFIADAGLQAIFRYDPMLDAMNMIHSVRVTQHTRLSAAPDSSVVIANGMSAPMVRLSRTGRVMQTIDSQLSGGIFYDEVAVDPVSGRYYGLDKVQRRLEEISPHGRGGLLLPQDVVPEMPSTMVIDAQSIYIAGRSCQCIAAIDTFGSRNAEVIAEDIGLVTAMAASDGWLAVADTQNQKIRLWRQRVLLAEVSFADLGLSDPRSMAIGQQTLFVADGAGRRVATFRMRA